MVCKCSTWVFFSTVQPKCSFQMKDIILHGLLDENPTSQDAFIFPLLANYLFVFIIVSKIEFVGEGGEDREVGLNVHSLRIAADLSGDSASVLNGQGLEK